MKRNSRQRPKSLDRTVNGVVKAVSLSSNSKQTLKNLRKRNGIEPTLQRWRHIKLERQRRWNSRQVLLSFISVLQSKYSSIKTRTSSLRWVNKDGGKITLDSISSGWKILVFAESLCSKGGTVRLVTLALHPLNANFFCFGGPKCESNMSS